MKAKNPTIKYIKSGIRKQNKLLFFKFLTLRKNKKATIIYSENIMISGLTLIKDINIDCNNSGATPKNKLSLTELFIFWTSKPIKKLGKKNESLYWTNIDIEKKLIPSRDVNPKKQNVDIRKMKNLSTYLSLIKPSKK